MTGQPAPVGPDPATEVQPSDLEHLPALHGILAALNDPGAGVSQLKDLCNQLPSLSARLIARARREAPHHEVREVGYALAILGNAGLEAVLLPYLEDLTILKTDLEEARASAPSSK
ncbi:MAG: hypothetical protein JNL21_23170 [Myxococcales bacterium]|nr:hypothetical protein [Myxococcales bacterium]